MKILQGVQEHVVHFIFHLKYKLKLPHKNATV